MSTRRKSKRVEQVLQSHVVRRSPRLSQRLGRVQTGDYTPHPLIAISYAATSRSSLESYSRAQEDREILNESGQSVPPSFDQDEEEQGLFSTKLDSTDSTTANVTSQPGHTHISAATAQLHHEDPSKKDVCQDDMPQHLFGLDDSDNESSFSEVIDPTPKKYHIYMRERVITPPKAPEPDETGRSYVGACMGLIVTLLYKCGSLLYLAATAMLCLDVVILHWLFTLFHSLAGGSEDRPTKSWHRFWILPVVLCGLVVFLIGGGLVPEPTPVEPPITGTLPLNYSDIVALRAEIVRHVTASLKKDLASFKESFRSEVESHMQQHINKHIDKVILTSEQKLESSMRGQVKSEEAQREAALQKLKQNILNELNSTLETQLGVLQSSLDGQMSSLRQTVLDKEASDISEAMAQVKNSSGKQIEAARKQWLKEAKEGILSQSADTLKKELLEVLKKKEQVLSKQISGVESEAKQELSTLQDKVKGMESQMEATSNDFSGLKQHVKRHDEEIASLQQKQSDILKEIANMKRSYLSRVNALEESANGSINSSEILEVFNEEMDKVLANPDSPLRSWLSKAFTSEDKMKEFEHEVRELVSHRVPVPGGGLTKQDVEQLIQAALAKYSADRIGKFDFALENVGGVVVQDKCSENFSPSLATVSLFGFSLFHVTSSPRAIIQHQVYPGDCWAFKGSAGHALIKLKGEIIITGVTLEHIPRELTPDDSFNSAPKDFSVWGKTSEDEEEEGQLLGTFSYDKSGPPIQEYTVHEGERTAYSYVLFKFLSNHGNPEYTCVYRVRVHGHGHYTH